jgi:organic radical activating enzyme
MIELTRRCNMTCPHCCKGEAENIDIQYEYIDALLDQSETIEDLYFFGGEPLLNIEAMEYTLDGIMSRNIRLQTLEISTNGYIYSEKMITLLKRYKEYIRRCKRDMLKNNDNKLDDVDFSFSLDKFHQHKDVCKKNYELYKSRLEGIAEVSFKKHANLPFNIGKAKNLDCKKLDGEPVYIAAGLMRIGICSKEFSLNECDVECADIVKLDYPEQRIVCCGLCLNAKGYLNTEIGSSLPYADIDNSSLYTICHVLNSNIWESIVSYNKYRNPCKEIPKLCKGCGYITPMQYEYYKAGAIDGMEEDEAIEQAKQYDEAVDFLDLILSDDKIMGSLRKVRQSYLNLVNYRKSKK